MSTPDSGAVTTSPAVGAATVAGVLPSARVGSAPKLVASILVLVGVLDVLAVLRPGLARRWEVLGDLLPGAVVSASAGVSVAVGVLLLGLARGIARGKRRAWRVTVALVATQVVVQAVQRHRVLLLLSLALLALLVVTQDQFRARSDSTTRRQVAVVTGALAGAGVLVGVIALALLARDEHISIGLGGLFVAACQGLVGITSRLTEPESRESDAIYYMLLSMGVATVSVAGILALRTARTPTASRDDERAIRSMLDESGGRDSLGYFATRDDRVVCWSDNGRAGVSYKVISGTALAAGDPIGPHDEWPGAVGAFLRMTRDHAWIPAVAAASERGAAVWSDVAGFSALRFGDEAVLETATFTLSGRAMRNVRQAAARATRADVVVRITRLSDVDATPDDLLRSLAREWLAQDAERGFSMSLGRIDARRDPGSFVVTAEAGGRAQALLVFVPWGRDGLSLDVMRRSDTATNGTTELMISTLMSRLGEWGIRRVSLNFVVFRETIEGAQAPQASRTTRAWGRTIKGVTRWSQVDSLYRFNTKFHPTWQPRYLLYPNPASLPRIAWTYLDAESFVPRPLARARARLRGIRLAPAKGPATAVASDGEVLSRERASVDG